MEGSTNDCGVRRSGSLASTAGSTDTKVSVDTRNSDKVTNSSMQSDWETPLRAEGSSAFVSLSPWNIFLGCRNARIVTVEPVLFLYMLGIYIYFPLSEQYYYLRYGIDQLRDTNFTAPNTSFCINSSEIDEYGGNGTFKVVESLSNNLLTYGSISNRVLSIIATLIMGPLSDKYGRRLIIIIVAIGMLIQGVFSLIIVYFDLSLYFFVLTQGIAGATGDFAAMLMACFTYVVDVGSLRWRTLRIAIAEAMLFLAGAIGEGLVSGLWLQTLNCDFIPPIWLCIACSVAIIGYTLAFLPESLSSSERQKHTLNKQSKLQSLAVGFKILFCQFKEYAAWKLWGGSIILLVVITNVAGAIALFIYYFKANLSLDWDPEITGYFLGVQQVSHMVALLVILPVLMVCKLPDALISLIGLAMNCAMNLFIGLASKTYQLFIGKFQFCSVHSMTTGCVISGTVLSLFLFHSLFHTHTHTHTLAPVASVGGVEAVMVPPLRSILSRVVPNDRQGR